MGRYLMTNELIKDPMNTLYNIKIVNQARLSTGTMTVYVHPKYKKLSNGEICLSNFIPPVNGANLSK